MENLYSNFDSLFGKTSILYYMCFVFVVALLKIETISSRNHLLQQVQQLFLIETLCFQKNLSNIHNKSNIEF